MALENKLGLTSSADLAREEERISKKKALELFENGILDKLEAGKFSALKAIHKYLFDEIYDFAGELRTVNISKAIYVFEVQSKGSIDSLLLNLKKAQSNAAVQAVVAVADEEQLAKIIRESAGVIDEKSLRTWNSDDVLAVYDSLARAHESINKLALVPESF
jgi:fido (protein-threonine AMPylation protein)